MLKRIIFLFFAVNFTNAAFAQYAQWLTTDPVCFYKSHSALLQEKVAKKYHLESVELTDYEGKFIKSDTLFETGRLVYSMTFTSTGNILTEAWPGAAVTNYYYNTNDLLYKISFPSGDSTLLYYNADKKLTYTKRYSGDTLFWGTAYTYDKENRLIGSNGYRVLLNKKDCKFIPQDSVYSGSYDWMYDDKGRLLNLRQYTPMDITKSALFSYEYLENGNIKVSEKTSYKFELIYDSSGHEIVYNSFFECDGAHSTYQQDEFGNNIVKTISRINKSNIVVTYQNLYASNGNGLLLGYTELNSRLPDMIEVWKIAYTFY